MCTPRGKVYFIASFFLFARLERSATKNNRDKVHKKCKTFHKRSKKNDEIKIN